MENEEIYCALCGRIPECEEPAVLTMGRYGHPRHLCEECESQMDIANLGRDLYHCGTKVPQFYEERVNYGL